MSEGPFLGHRSVDSNFKVAGLTSLTRRRQFENGSGTPLPAGSIEEGQRVFSSLRFGLRVALAEFCQEPWRPWHGKMVFQIGPAIRHQKCWEKLIPLRRKHLTPMIKGNLSSSHPVCMAKRS